MPRAGAYDQRFSFQRSVETQDDAGEPDSAWNTLATRFGDLQPLLGDERFQGMQTDTEVDHRLRIRYDTTLAALTPKDRVVKGSRTFDIQSVINVGEESRELELLLKELV
jgi:SPP1 family predicted phage head-tail adaptor